MINYFIAFNELSHDTREPLGTLTSAKGGYSNLGLAKIVAKEMTERGYKNVTVFEHDMYYGLPYDKAMTRYVSWDYVMKNKVE